MLGVTDTDTARGEEFRGLPSREVATQLVLLAAALGLDCTVRIKSDGVVGAIGDSSDVTQANNLR